MHSSSQVSLRRGIVNDAADLAAFAARAFAEAFAAENRPEDLAKFLTTAYGRAQQARELADPSMTTLLMHRGGSLAAFAQLRRGKPPASVTHASAIELQRIYVDKPEQGRGIAQQLMSAAFDAARQLEATHVWLGVWERNARAIAFYKKMGFVDVGSHIFVVGSDPQTDRLLVARL